MPRHGLRDEEWVLIKDIFPAPKKMGRPIRDRRTIVDAILWILRTGSPWRDLPEKYGPWATAWDLFDGWNGDGTLDKILSRLRAAASDAGEIDDELWCVDGTNVRAARCAAGGGKKTSRKNRKITLSGVPGAVSAQKFIFFAIGMAIHFTII